MAVFLAFCVVASATPMTDIIDKHFAGINEGSTLQTDDGSWVVMSPLVYCSGDNIDYNDPTGTASQSVIQDLMDLPGLTSLCTATPTDPTCRATDAVFAAFAELESKFATGPAFANYLPTWTNARMEAVRCRSGAFDLGTKTLNDKNGCNGWAMCDILTTVLTMSADQAETSTCGYVAVLTALSRANPAYALRIAVELIWTGSIREFSKAMPSTAFTSTGCDYVFHQLPGVQTVDMGNGAACGECRLSPLQKKSQIDVRPRSGCAASNTWAHMGVDSIQWSLELQCYCR